MPRLSLSGPDLVLRILRILRFAPIDVWRAPEVSQWTAESDGKEQGGMDCNIILVNNEHTLINII